MQPFYVYQDSPLGLIEIGATTEGIDSLLFVEQRRFSSLSSPLLEMALTQLEEYFSGARRQFDLPLDLRGSAFQVQVWQQVLDIPYGQTASYANVARALGRPRSARAVGMAVGQNPLTILVPCHRVIGSDGSLTGYGGGLWRKEWLLKHEGCSLA